ncbi:MAG: membrane protein insertase YidC [Roseiarcus sp.]
MNSEDSRNILLAIVLSGLVLIGWQYYFAAPQLQKARQAQTLAQAPATANPATANPAPAAVGAGGAVPAPGAAPVDAAPKTRAEALAASPRVAIDTASLAGSIDLTGGVVDDIVLKAYRETIDPHSANITLFSPQGGPRPYWAETGFVTDAPGVKTPNRLTLWSADSSTLSADKPVTLTWDNGAGLKFKRVIAVDDKYMFTIKDSVENDGAEPVSLRPYALILRRGKPDVAGYSILHEGFVGVIGGGGVQEVTYANIDKASGKVDAYTGDGGWLGFTDKYWASAIIPDPSEPIEARFSASGPAQLEDYQADFIGPALAIASGASADAVARVFAGAKEVATIDAYGKSLDIKKFDLMIDWGWFYFITKPLFLLIDAIYRYVGNFGLAILAITVLIKLAFFPLANQSYRSMAKMKKIQPQIAALKDLYPDDRVKQQQAQMELFKREGVNPVAGCLPMVVQIPVFFALYKVIFITIEMRQAPFYGWIKDLSVPDPTNLFTLFGLVPWDPSTLPVIGHFLMLGVWPLIMGLSMFLQMKMNPEPADPVQKTMFAWMPVIFTFMLGSFPVGLVIYWTWNNTLTILQQGYIMASAGVKVELWSNLKKLFVKTGTS